SGSQRRVRVNGVELELEPGHSLVVGRGDGADVRIDDPKVSRRHGMIEVEAQQVVYTDLASHNGTFRDGRKGNRVVISEPVTLLLGSGTSGAVLAVALLDPDAPRLRAEPVTARPSAGRVPESVELGERTALYPLATGSLRIGRDATNDVVLDDLSV